MKSGRSKLDKWDDLRMQVFNNPTQDEIKMAAKALKDGNLVAFPTETVYGLGADAENERAVSRIYSVKARPKDHPLIVHISSIDRLNFWARNIPKYAFDLANEFWPGPLTLILERSNVVMDSITGGQDFIGIRIPSNPIALILLTEFEQIGGNGVAAPSANIFGRISPTRHTDVIEDIGHLLASNDLVINGGQSLIGVESTILNCSKNGPSILRPGSITTYKLNHVLGKGTIRNPLPTNVKTSGQFKSHYAPKAQICINIIPKPGDGFIALLNETTPVGVLRLAAPPNVEEFARVLYAALRSGDHKGLKRIVIVLPQGDGLEMAILDRVLRAAEK